MSTYDELRGMVPIQIEGEERRLKFTQKAIRLLMDKLDVKVMGDLAKRLSVIDADVVQSAVWAGLQHEENPPDFDQVGDWFYPIAPAIASVTSAINLAMFGVSEGGSNDKSGPPASSSRKSRRGKKSSNASASPTGSESTVAATGS